MENIDVVSRFLEKEPCAETAIRVPVLEVEIPAVTDEVATPCSLDVSDGASVDQFLQLKNKGHMTHVVTQVEPDLLFMGKI